MVSFNVEPKNQERFVGGGVGKRPTVVLYYVGIGYDQAHKGFPPPVQIKTMTVKMPRLGEPVEIDEVYAKDLIFKTRYKEKNGEMRDSFVSAAQGGLEMARFIKEARAEGRSISPDELNRRAAKAQAQKYLPDEDLAELIEARGFDLPEGLLEALKAKSKGSTGLKEALGAEDLPVDLRDDNEKEAMAIAKGFAKEKK